MVFIFKGESFRLYVCSCFQINILSYMKIATHQIFICLAQPCRQMYPRKVSGVVPGGWNTHRDHSSLACQKVVWPSQKLWPTGLVVWCSLSHIPSRWWSRAARPPPWSPWTRPYNRLQVSSSLAISALLGMILFPLARLPRHKFGRPFCTPYWKCLGA